MPSIIALPNELLIMISDDLHANDIDSYSQSCKILYPLFEKHRERKRKYAHITLGGSRDPNGSWVTEDSLERTPLGVLRELLQNDKLAQYPRSLRVGCVFKEEEIARIVAPELLGSDKVFADQVTHLIRQAKQLRFWHGVTDQEWMERIMEGDSDATVALILNLLGNLETLRIVEGWGLSDPSLVDLTIRELCRRKQISLSTIHLDAGRYRDRFDESWFWLFMGSPSIRVIEGSWLRYSQNAIYNKKPVPSEVNTINLKQSSVRANRFETIFSNIRALKSFTFDFGEGMFFWQPHKTISLLETHAADTLTHLELTGTRHTHDSDPFEDEPFLGNLRGFKVLETTRLLNSLLFKPTLPSGDDMEPEKGEALPGGRSTTTLYENDLYLVETQRLVDFLPASAKKISLAGLLTTQEAEAMLADLAEERSRVPVLREIVLEDNDPLDDEVKAGCRAAGIGLRYLKGVTDRHRRIYGVIKPAVVELAECKDREEHTQ